MNNTWDRAFKRPMNDIQGLTYLELVNSKIEKSLDINKNIYKGIKNKKTKLVLDTDTFKI